MKKLILLISIISSVFAFNVGDEIPRLTFENQFEKTITLNENISYIIFNKDKKKADVIKEFLASKKEDFLPNKKAIYLADISGMPSIIASMFAIPKMKKYKFLVYFLNDEGEKYFNNSGENIVVYTFDKGKLKSVDKFQTKGDLEKFFK